MIYILQDSADIEIAVWPNCIFTNDNLFPTVTRISEISPFKLIFSQSFSLLFLFNDIMTSEMFCRKQKIAQ